MSEVDYRLYTITIDGKESSIAVPETNVATFDSILLDQPEGASFIEILNNIGAVLIG